MPTRAPRVPETLLVAIAAAAPVAAQCTTAWLPGDGVPGVDGTIHAMTGWDPDGTGPGRPLLVIGGRFTVAGNLAAQCVAAFEPVTGTWSSLGSGVTGALVAGYAPVVRSVLARANGELVVGGWFTTAGGAPAACVARWNGSVWSPLGTGVSGGAPYPADNVLGVRALVEDAAGDLVVAGQFDTAGGIGVANVARWTASGWAAMGGGIPGSGLNTRVNTLARLPNGDVIAGGRFALGNGLARWNGSGWTTFHGVNAGAEVLAAHVRPNGQMVVAGDLLSQVAAQWVHGIAAWNGVAWSDLGGGLGFLPSLGTGVGTALTTLANGDLLVAGVFESAGTTAATSVARWDGATWHAQGTGPRGYTDTGSRALQCLTTDAGGTSWLGGTFHRAGNRGFGSLARWNGTDWEAVGTGINRAVRAALRHSDGSLWLGGDFTTVGSTASGVGGVARFDGTAWSFLGGGVAGGDWGRVFDLRELQDGSVLAVGDFELAGGVASRNAARWTGSAWQPFGAGLADVNGDAIQRAFVQPDGTVWATGTLPFGSWIVTWATSTGGAWVMPPNGAANLRLLANDGAGRVAATGSMSGNGGLFEWTGTWAFLGHLTPNQPFGVVGYVEDATYTREGDLVIAGFFTSIAGVTADNVARRRNGVWQTLGTGLPSGYHPTRSLGIAPNGDVLALRAQPEAVVRWNGSAWTPLAGPLTTVEVAPARFAEHGGELLVAGRFGAAAGVVSANLARVRSTCPAAAAPAGAGCPSSGGANALAAQSLPWLGSALTLRGSGMPASALVAAVTGFSASSMPLSSVFAVAPAGCVLRATPDLVEVVVASTGIASWSLPIPSTPALVGLALYHQFVPFEFTGGALVAVTATNAVQSTLGVF